jgi:hypothetical protein
VENPNRALLYADAMARGDAPREVPAWRRIAEEEATEEAAKQQQHKGQQAPQAAGHPQQKQQQQQQQKQEQAGGEGREGPPLPLSPGGAEGEGAHPEDFYDDSAAADSAAAVEADGVHVLAGDVRRAQARVGEALSSWNAAVEVRRGPGRSHGRGARGACAPGMVWGGRRAVAGAAARAALHSRATPKRTAPTLPPPRPASLSPIPPPPPPPTHRPPHPMPSRAPPRMSCARSASS